jgi:acyl dehydratase
VWSPSPARELLTTATHDAMRNFARGYGDDNPLYTSEDYGSSTRWGGQIAPPMTPIGLNRPLYSDPPAVRIKRPSFRGIHVFVSGSTWRWYRPMMEGDQLYSFGGTESVIEKKSEFADRSVLVTYVSVKMNQRAEIVAISRTLAIHTERKTAREKGKYAAIEPARYSDEDIASLDAIYAAEEVQGGRTRWWEDVNVGDVLTPMAKGPLTTTDMIVFHLCEERIRRARRGPARALGFGLGPSHRQPDGVRLRGNARLLAVSLHDRLDGRRWLARRSEQ